jgi:hypothetical protein
MLRRYHQARLYAGFYFADACGKWKNTAQRDENSKR